MKVERNRARRRAALLVATAVAMAVAPLARADGVDVPAPPGAPAEPEPRCHRDQDLACTVVRETPAGVWVWTERFRPAEPGTTGWTLAVGAGPVSAVPSLHFVATPTPTRPTPNGAPILE